MDEIAAAAAEDAVKTKAAKNAAPAVAENAQEQPVGPDLNISDLLGAKSVIDVATQRGVFKANELEAVGKLYNRLSAFIEHATKKE